MKKQFLFILLGCCSFSGFSQQIYLANNGLTAAPATGTTRTVSLGGVLNNAQTVIDFGSTNTSSNLLFQKGAVVYMYIGNNGNTGLGTATPTSLFSLGSTAINSKLAVFDNGTTLRSGLGWATGQFRLHLSATTDKFSFLSTEAAATDLMTILGTGNIGIGTSTPANRLSIASATAGTSGLQLTQLTSAATAGNSIGKVLTVDASGNLILVKDSISSPIAGWFLNGNTVGAVKYLGTVDNFDLPFMTNNTERFRMTATGNLGIGTTSPLAQLHTTGTLRFDKFKNNATGDSVLTTDVSGNVLFKKFTVSSTVDSSKWTLSGVNIFNKNSGNVGIGTSTPANKLSIASATAGTSGLQFTQLTSAATAAASNGKVLSLDASGNVILVKDSLGAGNGAGWSLTGNSGTVAGTNFIGTTDNIDLVFKRNNVTAGLLNFSLGSTFYGVGAGNLSSSGAYNTGIGVSALLGVNTGLGNTALGHTALTSISTGSANTATGWGALKYNGTGGNNAAFGNDALSVVTSSGNTGIGSLAGNAITTGIQNTLLGYNTGQGLVTGSYNTILGANVSGLAPALMNNIILADGQGNIKGRHDGSKWVLTGGVDIGAGQLISGTGTGNFTFTNGSGNGWYFDWFQNGANGMRLSTNNNLLIGTTTDAGYKLDVNGNSRTSGNLDIGNFGGQNSINFLHHSGGASGLYFYAESKSTLRAGLEYNGDSAQTYMYTPYNGVQKSVILDGNTSDVYLNTYRGSDNFRFNALVLKGTTGNVGVGIKTPTAKLHLIAGTTGAGSAPLKFTAGSNLTTPEDGAIEYNGSHFYATVGSTRYQLDQQAGGGGGTGWAITGNAGTVPYTNFIGTSDNKDVIFKRNNVLSGLLDSIDHNTFFGYGSGKNTFIDPSNLTFYGIGTNNSFFGYGAGTSNSTGGGNNFIGVNAGYNNSTGNFNDFIGVLAGANNTTGNSNFMNGAFAGQLNTTGSANVFIGSFAGSGNTIGSHNIYLGINTALLNQTGNSNTIIGDSTASTLVTGNYNTIIGAKIIGLNPGLSNNIILADGQGNIKARHDGTNWTLTGGLIAGGISYPVINGTSGQVLTTNGAGIASWQTPTGGTGSSNWSTSGSNIYNANAGLVIIGTVPTNLPIDAKLKLAVNGNIYAQKLKITQTGWADYVFDPTYKLRPLSEVETFIRNNQHLPEMPSAKEIELNGNDLGDNQVLLLKKIEELTLYTIEQNKKQEAQQITIEAQQRALLEMKEELELLKKGKQKK